MDIHILIYVSISSTYCIQIINLLEDKRFYYWNLMEYFTNWPKRRKKDNNLIQLLFIFKKTNILFNFSSYAWICNDLTCINQLNECVFDNIHSFGKTLSKKNFFYWKLGNRDIFVRNINYNALCINKRERKLDWWRMDSHYFCLNNYSSTHPFFISYYIQNDYRILYSVIISFKRELYNNFFKYFYFL